MEMENQTIAKGHNKKKEKEKGRLRERENMSEKK